MHRLAILAALAALAPGQEKTVTPTTRTGERPPIDVAAAKTKTETATFALG